MVDRNKAIEELTEVEEELLRCFTEKPRHIPARPAHSSTSVLVVRKEWLPFYYAIYDHDLKCFVALQYRHTRNAPMRTIRIPAQRQPQPDDPIPRTIG